MYTPRYLTLETHDLYLDVSADLRSPNFDHHFLGLADVQDQVVVWAPLCYCLQQCAKNINTLSW